MRRWCSLAVVAACYRPGAQVCDDPSCLPDAADPDGFVADGPLPDGAQCVGTQPMDFCYSAPLTPVLVSPFDTDNQCPLVQDKGGREVCVVQGSTVTVPSGNLQFTGSRPLVLVGTELVQIDGVIDLSGSVERRPAGSQPSAFGECRIAGIGMGRSGAGGGGFVNQGGAGGGMGGMGGGIPTTSGVRGGCIGGFAGGSKGGHGGGALYVVSAAIVISGSGGVNASGGGGSGGGLGSGGAGGGSGGYIGFDAPIFSTVGHVTATGGGGGGGGCADTVGDPGETPLVATPLGEGGNSPGGGAGGNGGTEDFPAKDGFSSVDNTCGGGGGGGGLGRVQMFQGTTCSKAQGCDPEDPPP